MLKIYKHPFRVYFDIYSMSFNLNIKKHEFHKITTVLFRCNQAQFVHLKLFSFQK